MIATAGRFRTTGPFCICGGTFFINDRCVSCRGLMQKPMGVNNTLAGDEGFVEMKESRQQNADEYDRILAELKKADKPPPRKNPGLFTKRVLAKVEERFPRQRSHRRQNR